AARAGFPAVPPFAEHEAATTSAGGPTISAAAREVTGWDEDTLASCASAIGDLGEAVSLLLAPNVPEGPSIADAEAFFRGLAAARKTAEKRALLVDLLKKRSAVAR